MMLFEKKAAKAKLLGVFWLVIGVGITVGGLNKLLVEGVTSFIPWAVFLVEVAVTAIAIFGSQSRVKAIQIQL
jgi:hypothetical protein